MGTTVETLIYVYCDILGSLGWSGTEPTPLDIDLVRDGQLDVQRLRVNVDAKQFHVEQLQPDGKWASGGRAEIKTDSAGNQYHSILDERDE